MPPAEGYELSRGYMMAFVHALHELKFFEIAKQSVPADLHIALDDAPSRLWWAPTAAEAAGLAVWRNKGESAIEDVGYHTIVPVTAPSVKMTTSLFGRSPGVLLSKLDRLTSAAVRGVTVSFQSETHTSGTVTVKYPQLTAPRSNGLLWKGSIRRFLRATTGDPRVRSMQGTTGTFTYPVTWTDVPDPKP